MFAVVSEMGVYWDSFTQRCSC